MAVPMSSVKIFATLVVLALCTCAFHTPSEGQGYLSPVWRREIIDDLRSNRPERLNPNMLVQSDKAGITFLNAQKLAAYAVTFSNQLSSRESPESSAGFWLRVRLVDAQSGKTELTKDFGTRSHGSTVQVTTGGILVKTGLIVKLYSQDFAEAKDVARPLEGDQMILTSTSPTGKTIMVNRINPSAGVSHFTVFDANTLELRESWDQTPPLYIHYSISDEKIVAIAPSDQSVVDTVFGSKRWNVLLRKSRPNCPADKPVFTSEGQIIARNCGDLVLLTASGAVYSLGSLDGRKSDKTAVSKDGRFVAISLDEVEMKKHLFTEPSSRLIATRVAVYDLTLRKCIFTLDVDPLPKNDYDFALSPDGSRLAVLNDRNVAIYSVPVRTDKKEN